jgi:hypothetical protein
MAIHWCLSLHLNVVGGLRNAVGCRRPRWSWVEGARRPNRDISGENNNEYREAVQRTAGGLSRVVWEEGGNVSTVGMLQRNTPSEFGPPMNSSFATTIHNRDDLGYRLSPFKTTQPTTAHDSCSCGEHFSCLRRPRGGTTRFTA